MEPWNKSLNFILPTKYVIPKKLRFSHWPSKIPRPSQTSQFSQAPHSVSPWRRLWRHPGTGGPENCTHWRGNEARITPALFGGLPKMMGFPNKPMGCFLRKMISTWGGDWGGKPSFIIGGHPRGGSIRCLSRKHLGFLVRPLGEVPCVPV